MKNLTKIALLLSITLITTSSVFAASCPTSIIGSCAMVGSGNTTCIDYANANIPVDQIEAQCTSSGSVFSTSPCSTASVVGSCSIQDTVVMRFYAPFPANYVEMICGQASGTICQ